MRKLIIAGLFLSFGCNDGTVGSVGGSIENGGETARDAPAAHEETPAPPAAHEEPAPTEPREEPAPAPTGCRSYGADGCAAHAEKCRWDAAEAAGAGVCLEREPVTPPPPTVECGGRGQDGCAEVAERCAWVPGEGERGGTCVAREG